MKGPRNIFLSVEPKGGKRYTKVTQYRKKKDFAMFIKDLVMRKYKSAKKVHIVLDNLNTHFKKSFYETFSQKEAEEILSRIEFHYTPKHASWLNMAEIEIGIMDRQCLNRRIPTVELLKSGLKAWQKDRNKKKKVIQWKFTKQDADLILKPFYNFKKIRTSSFRNLLKRSGKYLESTQYHLFEIINHFYYQLGKYYL